MIHRRKEGGLWRWGINWMLFKNEEYWYFAIGFATKSQKWNLRYRGKNWEPDIGKSRWIYYHERRYD